MMYFAETPASRTVAMVLVRIRNVDLRGYVAIAWVHVVSLPSDQARYFLQEINLAGLLRLLDRVGALCK